MRIELGKGPLFTRRVINGPTMGSRFVATFFAPLGLDLAAVARDLQAAVNAVDEQMSTWKPDSALMRFNRSPVGEWFALPPEMAQVIGAALQIGRASGGAFDIGVGDLVVDWGFSPGDASGVAERSRPALEALEFDAVGLRLRKRVPITLDLNGIAKGFGVDELARVLSAHGVRHYLVAIDGEVRAAGGRPDGTPWQVAIEAPEEGRRSVDSTVDLIDGALATSGDYRHFVERDGERHAHTMDPKNRAPLRHGIASVTVRAETCMAADAWATALLVLGPEAGLPLAAAQGIEALYMERVPQLQTRSQE